MIFEFGTRCKRYGCLTFYNNITDDTYYKMEMTLSSTPEDVQCSENKMFLFYFEAGEFMHIRELFWIYDKLLDQFEELNFELYLDESMLMHLDDSRNSKFVNTEYQDMDFDVNIQGTYNLGLGFKLVMIKHERGPINEEEQNIIKNIIKEVFKNI